MTAAEFVEEFALRLRTATAGHSLVHTYTAEGFESYKAVILGIFEEMGIQWGNATWVTDGVVSYGQDIAIATGETTREAPNKIQPADTAHPVGVVDAEKRNEPGP